MIGELLTIILGGAYYLTKENNINRKSAEIDRKIKLTKETNMALGASFKQQFCDEELEERVAIEIKDMTDDEMAQLIYNEMLPFYPNDSFNVDMVKLFADLRLFCRRLVLAKAGKIPRTDIISPMHSGLFGKWYDWDEIFVDLWIFTHAFAKA